jgi:hypothetical protein
VHSRASMVNYFSSVASSDLMGKTGGNLNFEFGLVTHKIPFFCLNLASQQSYCASSVVTREC